MIMDLKVLFEKVPPEFRKEYRIAQNRDNLSRLEVFSLFVMALALISLFSRVLTSGESLFSDRMLPFTVLFTAEALISLFFILFVYLFVRKVDASYYGGIILFFVMQVLAWAAVLSLYNFRIEGDFSAYILGVITIALVYRTGPLRMALLLCLTAVGFSVGYLLFGGGVKIGLRPVNALMYSAMGWFISLFLEKNQRTNFLYGKLLEKKNEELVEMSFRDPLTNLYNRRYFIEFLENQLAFSRRTASPLSVILMDLDFFKKINDSMGHIIGDSVLRELSLLIQGLIRDSDIVARYGGEEFIVILPQTGLASASGVAERIRETVKQTDFRGLPWSLTLSAGVTELRNGDTQETMLARADQRLYTAKISGRDRIIAQD
jgi:diguanylate cyclase (GGDEF)-like protein